MSFAKLACIAATAGMISTAAEAVIFNYSYTDQAGDVLSGQLDGMLQGDGNTVLVDAILSADVNGAARPALPFVDSVSNRFAASGAPATVSLDGSMMDLIACTSDECNDGFSFDSVGVPGGGGPGGPLYGTGVEFGGKELPYLSENWSLSVIPLPASLLLLLTGLGGLGGLGLARLRAA